VRRWPLGSSEDLTELWERAILRDGKVSMGKERHQEINSNVGSKHVRKSLRWSHRCFVRRLSLFASALKDLIVVAVSTISALTVNIGWLPAESVHEIDSIPLQQYQIKTQEHTQHLFALYPLDHWRIHHIITSIALIVF
jgi:hypothetical protein